MSTVKITAGRRDDANATSALLLLLLAFVPYVNTLSDAFVYDDQFQVAANPYAHSFRYLGKIFGGTVWTFQGAQGISNYYRPLMTLAYLLCYKLYGPIPFGFHLLNVILHAAVVLLLFAVTLELFRDRLLAMIAAGLFALHPIHTESVSWIAGITDLELSVFFLLTFLLYLGLPQSEASGHGWRRQILILASYVLALLSKEQALMLPLVICIYEHFYQSDRQTTSFARKIQRYAPLWVTVGIYIAFRHFVLGSFAPSQYRAALPWSIVLLTAVGLVGGYLWKLIWPVHFVAFYVFHEVTRPSDPRFIGGLIGLAACLGIFLWLWRKDHAISFSFLWMGATLAPVLDARLLPAQVFAERYLYLPSAGFCWLVAWAAAKAWRATSVRNSPPHASSFWRVALGGMIPASLVVVGALYGVRTVLRNRDWRTEDALYRQTLAAQPEAQLIRINLGVLYWDRGDPVSAEREWTASMTGPHAPYPATLNDLGMARLEQKRYSEAIDFFNRAIALNLRFMDPHKNLGTVYAQLGRFDDADREYRNAVTLAPLSTDAHNTYGLFLLDHDRLAEAAQQFELSVKADDNFQAQENLGSLFLRQGDLRRARVAFQSALALNTFDNQAHFGLAEIDEREANASGALEEYRAGLGTDPTNTVALAAVKRLEGRAQQ